MPPINDLLAVWLHRVSKSKRAHYDSARHYGRLNNQLGIPVVVLSTFVGTSVFATLEQEVTLWLRITIGLISVLAAVLAGLQTFLKQAERAEKHRLAGAAYGALQRSIELAQEKIQQGQALPDSLLEEFRTAMDQAAREAPGVSTRIWQRVEKRTEKRKGAA